MHHLASDRSRPATGPRPGAATLETILALTATLAVITATVLARLPDARHFVASLGQSRPACCTGDVVESLLEYSRAVMSAAHMGGDADAGFCTLDWWGTELTERDARQLAACSTAIFIRRVAVLDAGAATALGSSTATLYFDALRELPAAAARGLAGHAAGIRLHTLPTIDAATAAALGTCRGPLNVDGLESLDRDVARGLSAHRGLLALNGVRHLDPETAAILARHEGGLCLNGLTSISAPTAAALAHHEYALHMNSLETLPDDVAAALASFRGKELSLDGVRPAVAP